MPSAPTPTGSEIPYETERSFFVRTGAVHRFVLPTDWMTIVFTGGDQTDLSFPRYVLRSTDGAYHQVRTPADDLVAGDAFVELRFDGLVPGRRYMLVRHDDASIAETVFDDLPFAEIVDRVRPMHDALVAHGYAELLLEFGPGELFGAWTEDDEREHDG